MSFGRRPNPVYSAEYRALISILSAARKQAGVTQRALAAGLGKASSHVQRIESGQRRVDVLELYRIAKLLQLEPAYLFEQIASRLDALEAEPQDQMAPCGAGTPLATRAANSPDRISGSRGGPSPPRAVRSRNG